MPNYLHCHQCLYCMGVHNYDAEEGIPFWTECLRLHEWVSAGDQGCCEGELL